MFSLWPRPILRRTVRAAVLVLALLVGLTVPLSASAAGPALPASPTPSLQPTKPATQAQTEQPGKPGRGTTNAATGVRVVAPRPDSLQRAHIHVKIRVPRGTRHIRLRLAGKDVSKAVRHHGRFVTATLTRTVVKPGRASLVMRAHTAGGDPLFGQVPIVVGQHTARLLAHKARVTKQSGTAALHLTFRVRPTVLTVQLNGHDVPTSHVRRAGAVSMPLAADDGLRFGVNTVKVTGYDKGSGGWVRSSIHFRIGRGTPLVSAGPDSRFRLGGAVRLSAAATKWTRSAAAATRTFQWQIVRQPRFADARLADANAAQPTLSTPRPGVYRVKLTVREAGRTVGSDTVTHEAAPNLTPYGAELTTLVANGDGTTRTTLQGVPLNAQNDAQNDFIDTPANAIQVIVLTKSNLEFVSSAQVSGSAATLAAIHSVTNDQLGILVGAKGCCDPAQTIFGLYPANGFTTVFSNGGASAPILQNAGNAIGGAPPGAIGAWVRPTVSDSVAGQTGDPGFTVTNSDTADFDTDLRRDASDVAVRFAGQTYEFAPPASQGIFVLALNSALDTVFLNNPYAITGTVSTDTGTLETIVSQLQNVSLNDPGSVLMVQTWGSPFVKDPLWGVVGDALQQFGGTPTVWNTLSQSGGDYTLVGRAGAGTSAALRAVASVESVGSVSASPPGGNLRGLIGRGTDSLPVILGSTSAPVTSQTDRNNNSYIPNPLGLTELALAAPQPWPAMDGNKLAAYKWISQTIGYPENLGSPSPNQSGDCYQPTAWDIRAEYCNLTEESTWGGQTLTNLNTLVDCQNLPQGVQFSSDDCTAVKAQLLTEFPMVPVVQDLFTQLGKPFTDSQAAASQNVQDASDNVANSLGVTNPPPATSSLQQIVSDFFQPAQDLDLDSTALFGIGLLASALDLALNQTTDDTSGNPALATFTADKDAIGTDAIDRLTGADNNLAPVEEMVLSDWTKLSTTSYNAGGVWGQSPDVISDQKTLAGDSTSVWLYQAEMPVAYGQVRLALQGGTTLDAVNDFYCLYSDSYGNPHYAPFVPGATVEYDNGYSVNGGRPMPASAVFTPTVISANGTYATPTAYLLANPDNESFQTPLASLTDPLFTSTANGGVGLNQAEFYTWGWLNASTRFDDYMAEQPLASKLMDSHGGSPTTCPDLVLTDSRVKKRQGRR